MIAHDEPALSVWELFVERVPHEFARRHLVLGVTTAQGPCIEHGPAVEALTLHNLRKCLAIDFITAPVHAESLAHRIDQAYLPRETGAPSQRTDTEATPVIQLEEASDPADASDLQSQLEALARDGDRDLLALGNKGPVVRLVDAIIFDAIVRQASDLHIQALADATLVRYRIDGVLLTVRRVPARLAASIVSRIKVMARMDVAERRAPQDGRATVTIGSGTRSRSIDLRISTLPSAYGERVVIRLLDTDRNQSHAGIDQIGMSETVKRAFLDRAGRSSGIVLVTGPTGSGKTTTLYATLRWLLARSFTGNRAADVNVLTIEDPIEYDLSAAGTSGGAGLPISQTQVDTKKGVTFATGLRHMLRQDPDVIMVGEVRDAETAKIAIQASLTGHLVFSTLHTSDSAGAVTRLLDLGIEPYLVSSSLSCVLAQRLLRTLHGPCTGAGCSLCLGSGYKGRVGIFELLVLDEGVRQLIGARASAIAIRDHAVSRGMRRLEDEGRALVEQGITSLAEVQRVTLGVDEA
jgi:general secretion pathway protein E